MRKQIINIDELQYQPRRHGEKFGAERAEVATRIGAEKLGYAVVRVEPGKSAWPYHSHHVNEEMFFILEGEGTLRHADEEFPIRKGDFIASPADPGQPHQIVNTSDQPLCYIALSTMEPTDVFLYPDSGKYGVWHGRKYEPDNPRNFLVFARKETAVDYWDGEGS